MNVDIKIDDGVVYVGSMQYDSMHVATTDELVTYATDIASAKTAYYNAHQTALWTTLQADMDAYPAVKATMVASINAVTDTKSKQAFNDVKALIQQLQQEITDLKHVVGQGQQMEP